jgi:hypothetical protein
MGEMPLNQIEILELTVAKLQTELLASIQRVSVAEEKLDLLAKLLRDHIHSTEDDLK